MANRFSLQTELETILGSRNVYFQPPESIKLSYPCIVYDYSGERNEHADNTVYKMKNVYTITIIDRNPDSTIGTKMRNTLMYCRFSRSYSADNLHHFVYELYY